MEREAVPRKQRVCSNLVRENLLVHVERFLGNSFGFSEVIVVGEERVQEK